MWMNGLCGSDMSDIVQLFKGYIYEITQDVIRAQLEDLTNSKNVNELVDIPIEIFNKKDRELLMVGANFYWEIDDKGKYKIYLCETPKWTEEQINFIKSEATRLFESFSTSTKEDET